MMWQTHIVPMLLTVALWWGSTAVIARLIVGDPQRYPFLLRLFATIGAAGFAMILALREVNSTASAVAALLAALAVWSWIEVTFLTGKITGLAAGGKLYAATSTGGFARHAASALAAILWHELLIIATVVIVAIGPYGSSNDLALLVLLLLWLMRSSAKLNLFLGVRNLGEGFFPPHLQHLLGFMRQRRMNPLMPVSLLLAGAIGWHFGNVALTVSSTHEAAAATIIATLAVLALFEHLLMILPVPAETLWRWSLANRRSSP